MSFTRTRNRRGTTLRIAILIVAFGLSATAAVAATTSMATKSDCGQIDKSRVKCSPGKGKHDTGKGGASHVGWPGITGIHWQVIANADNGEAKAGTKWNDELLGRNGSDVLSGGDGNDVIWGDSNPDINGAAQHDTLNGGNGNDWIYASHGANTIIGGPGNDHVTAAFGHGTIDCGPGKDTLDVRKGHHYKVVNCEHRNH